MLKKDFITLQEKIKIFERFLEEGNTEIKGDTVFEGYPIGKWGIQIRSCLKRSSKVVNPTEEQLKQLSKLGILKRQIDSTMDEKIDAVIEWHKKYPEIKIERRNQEDKITEKTMVKLQELARKSDIEFSKIEEEYKKIQRYNEYIKNRDVQGKLTEQQKSRCKEANLGGRLGFSKENEEKAKKYQISVEKVYEISKRYGSVENYLQMYREGKLSEEKIKQCNQMLVNNILDIDLNPNNRNYINLICSVFGKSKEDWGNDINLYSSKKIDKILKENSPREEAYMRERYGLDSGKEKILDECGIMFNVSKERCRQIENKTLRYLKTPAREKSLRPIEFKKIKENPNITEDEKNELIKIENDLWKDEVLLKGHQNIEETEFDTSRFENIKKILIELEERERKNLGLVEEQEENQKIQVREIEIKNIKLSVRTLNCLRRAGIRTLGDLENFSVHDIERIRNVGPKIMIEIVNKAKEFGIVLRDDEKEIEIETETKIETEKDDELEKMKRRKEELEKQLINLGIQAEQAKELLNKYYVINGEEKTNSKGEI